MSALSAVLSPVLPTSFSEGQVHPVGFIPIASSSCLEMPVLCFVLLCGSKPVLQFVPWLYAAGATAAVHARSCNRLTLVVLLQRSQLDPLKQWPKQVKDSSS